MQLGKYSPRRLLLGLGVIGIAAFIACSVPANSLDEGYVTAGQQIGDSNYVFQGLYEGNYGIQRKIDMQGQDYGPMGYAIDTQGKEFDVIVGAIFPVDDKFYCVTDIDENSQQIFYRKIDKQKDCSYLPQMTPTPIPTPRIMAV